MDSIAKLGTPMDILQVALKKEQAAYEFYTEVRDHAKVAFIQELAEELCEEEHRHIRLIEKHIRELKQG